jgi:hypothetical protein
MRTRKELKLHATHFKLCAGERVAPHRELKDFDPEVWELVSAEVRTDTGKFVNSAWDVNIGGRRWRVVIGLHDTVETAFTVKYVRGPGGAIVQGGTLYDFVENVNRELMQREARIPSESVPASEGFG